MMTGMRRVLSIQSHVVHGYVGNKCAIFPLQVLGFDADAINSVQFSNHTGYGFWKGQVLTSTDLDDLMLGLRSNVINHYSHLLTGYIGSESFLLRVKDVVKELKKINPQLTYVCDPVMGDNGEMYVPKELLPVYREHIVPLATIVTPNQYEAELLTGEPIKNEIDAIKAMDWFHSRGVETVVLSSTNLGSNQKLVGLASRMEGGCRKVIRAEVPLIPVTFTGTGDLFAALFLAWMDLTQSNMKQALENTIGTMQSVLNRSYSHAQDVSVGGPMTTKHLEIQLVQSLTDIQKPNTTVQAQEVQL